MILVPPCPDLVPKTGTTLCLTPCPVPYVIGTDKDKHSPTPKVDSLAEPGTRFGTRLRGSFPVVARTQGRPGAPRIKRSSSCPRRQTLAPRTRRSCRARSIPVAPARPPASRPYVPTFLDGRHYCLACAAALPSEQSLLPPRLGTLATDRQGWAVWPGPKGHDARRLARQRPHAPARA